MTRGTDQLLPPLEPLAAWAGRLAPGVVTFGTWKGGEANASGTRTWPFIEYHPLMTAFIEEAYSRGWILSGFDWSDWIARGDGMQLATHPRAIGEAPAADLFRLLTAILRQERFCEGAFLDAAEAGIIKAVARRAAVLAREGRPGHAPA